VEEVEKMGYDFFKKPIYPKNIRYSENETYYIDCGCGEIARKQYKKNIYLCPTCGQSYTIRNNKYYRATHYIGLR
jgi:predicted RNA-binding Zn-ribbon protein involved in translation (DUF1610 family)